MSKTDATENHGRLVLSRKVGQRIFIAPNIWITVSEARGDKVRLTIEAPKKVQVFRDELLEPEDRHDVVFKEQEPIPERKTA